MKEHQGLMIKSIREASNLSQRELAKKVGVSRTKISEIENGRDFSEEDYEKLGSALAETIELSYIAGLFDRKSIISIMKWETEYLNRNPGRASKSPLYPVRVQFFSKHKLFVDIIRKVLGTGSITKVKNHSNPEKPYYYYMAWSASAEDALEQLLPYIKLKRPQVEACLELRQLQNFNRYLRQERIIKAVKRKGGRTGFDSVEQRPLDDETLVKMEKLYLRVKELNKAL